MQGQEQSRENIRELYQMIQAVKELHLNACAELKTEIALLKMQPTIIAAVASMVCSGVVGLLFTFFGGK